VPSSRKFTGATASTIASTETDLARLRSENETLRATNYGQKLHQLLVEIAVLRAEKMEMREFVRAAAEGRFMSCAQIEARAGSRRHRRGGEMSVLEFTQNHGTAIILACILANGMMFRDAVRERRYGLALFFVIAALACGA
jgi:hypothetical protein